MIVYHGSNSNFKQLRIEKRLCKTKQKSLNEGYGIYFSTYSDVARAYGKYIYQLELNDRFVMDFNNRGTCEKYVNKLMEDIYLKFKVDARMLRTYKEVVNGLACGKIEIDKLGSELAVEIDNDYGLYEKYIDSMSIKKHESFISYIEGLNGKYLKAYTYPSNEIRGVGIIKDVSADVVRIINKTKLF